MLYVKQKHNEVHWTCLSLFSYVVTYGIYKYQMSYKFT